MSKFPVELDDDEGHVDALNYLLSGPSGLGQNFAGFSTFAPAYITGNFRTPFTTPNLTSIYLAPISCTSAEPIDERTFKYTFSSTQSTSPFQPGQNLIGAGWSDDFYNGSWNPIGVVSCTTTYVIVRTQSSYPSQGSDLLGGTVQLTSTFLSSDPTYFSTDCNARVTVTGGTDRVFISAQLDQLVTYDVLHDSPDLTVSVQINRYIGQINNDPVNPDYIFTLDGTVAKKDYIFTGLHTDGTLPLIETVFTTVLDQPKPNFYWYILEVSFSSTTPSDIQVVSSEFKLRSLSSQVVKQ